MNRPAGWINSSPVRSLKRRQFSLVRWQKRDLNLDLSPNRDFSLISGLLSPDYSALADTQVVNAAVREDMECNVDTRKGRIAQRLDKTHGGSPKVWRRAASLHTYSPSVLPVLSDPPVALLLESHARSWYLPKWPMKLANSAQDQHVEKRDVPYKNSVPKATVEPSQLGACEPAIAMVHCSGIFNEKTKEFGVQMHFGPGSDLNGTQFFPKLRKRSLEKAEVLAVIVCLEKLLKSTSEDLLHPQPKRNICINTSDCVVDLVSSKLSVWRMNKFKNLKSECSFVEDAKRLDKLLLDVQQRGFCVSFSSSEKSRSQTLFATLASNTSLSETPLSVSKSKKTVTVKSCVRTKQPVAADNCVKKKLPVFETKLKPQSFDIYIDGACAFQGQSGVLAGSAKTRMAIGVYFGADHPLNLSQQLPRFKRQTSNRAELLAAIRAVELAVLDRTMARRGSSLYLFTDSLYVVNHVTKNFSQWRKTKWKGTKDVPNVAELKKLDKLLQKAEGKDVQVDFSHIKGHSNSEGNKAAHALAAKALEDYRKKAEKKEMSNKAKKDTSAEKKAKKDTSAEKKTKKDNSAEKKAKKAVAIAKKADASLSIKTSEKETSQMSKTELSQEKPGQKTGSAKMKAGRK